MTCHLSSGWDSFPVLLAQTFSRRPLLNMALPKSMRYLAGATLCIFLYLFVQLTHSPRTEIELPSSKPSLFKPGGGDHDPQLDRRTPSLCSYRMSWLTIFRSIRRTCRPSTQSRRQQLCTDQPKQRAHKCRHYILGTQRGGQRYAAEHVGPGANVEPQVQLPVDILQRQTIHGGVQEEDSRSDKG